MNYDHEQHLQTRLNELESIVNALRGEEIDAILGTDKVLLLRLREAEQALAESESWLRLLTEAGEVGLLEWNLENNQARCNQPFCDIIRCDLGSEFSIDHWLDHVEPEDRACVDDAIQKALQEGGVCDYECRVRAGDEVRWVEYRGKVQRDDNGRAIRVIGAVRNITPRKEAEIALESANRKMEARIAARTHALHRQTLQLRKLASQAMSSEHRERRRLAKLLHDHLQQYLVAAKMQLHFVQRSTNLERLQEAVQKSIMLMEESIELTRGLSRELRPPVLYEEGFIPAVRWLAGEMRDLHGLTVSVDAPGDAEPAGEDLKSLLFECVRELLFNVVKYANVGEASVDVRQMSPESLQITVADAGVGFDPAQISHRESPGVGLFRIRERLASIGGGMDISSKPGEGTRVVLRAPVDVYSDGSPLDCEGAEQDRPGLFDPDAPEDRIRVLVVDDHIIVREGIASMVEGPSMTVVAQAADGVEAVEAVERFHPQVILMDLNMPRMNGIEATRAIRERWPDVAIIGLSVQDDQATAQSLQQAGADAFIPKNHDPDHLIETILTVI